MADIEISDLSNFKYNGEKYLYKLQPEQDNLFMVTKFCDPLGSGENDFDNKNWIQYQIKGVSFDGDQLSFDENYTTNFFRSSFAQDLQFVKSVKIDWIEDVDRHVYTLHREWLNSWYNRSRDCISVGVKGKFKNLEITVFKYVNINNGSYSPVLVPQVVGYIYVYGLIPEKIPEMRVSFDNPNNEGTISMTYRCSSAVFESFNPAAQGEVSD